MVRRNLAFIFVFMLAFAAIGHADRNTVVGVVTNVGPGAIEVETDSGQTMCLSTDLETKYMKWIIQKPWGQDPQADPNSLRVGQRVHIDVAGWNSTLASTVWIVVGRIGY